MGQTALDEAALTRALQCLPGWAGDSGGIARTFTFATFAEAIAYMQACVLEIDRLDHHPEWSNVYNKVAIRLRTHGAGNRVTALDTALATVLARIATERGAR